MLQKYSKLNERIRQPSAKHFLKDFKNTREENSFSFVPCHDHPGKSCNLFYFIINNIEGVCETCNIL